MYYLITTISLAAVAQALSAATLPHSHPCYPLTTSQNQSRAQIHTNGDFLVVAADQNTSQFFLRELTCTKSTYTKKSSSEGGGTQTPPQQKDEKPTLEKSKVTSQSFDEDDYILDEYGCPELTKNILYCMFCGGSDENGRCKGVSGCWHHNNTRFY
ncbi:hypothetical protein DM02DRAFT_616184 [Periconia macrospinosa]|uniref:Uncharacterized protein n=1 Tax=Periconia macrospinosa TaxID=97972 RepID=A0A2V1DL53_9PLEO|nr:hypothetical protein DM02DRAFT_616184 [Periconia macrospinosa]